MRTTLTLDSDIAARLERLRRNGKTLKELVNDALRAGLDELEGVGSRPPARRRYTAPMDLGEPLVPLDDISEVLELLDVEEWRGKLR